jgi:phage recombination protein Bet
VSNAVATIEPPSVLGSMAERFGMDRRAFEATLRGTIMPANTSNEQCAAFLLVAKQHGLNPFTKEIFAFPSRGGIQPVVSVDGWMKLINSHPQFDGMEFVDAFDAAGKLASVTCKIFRKDRAHPVSVTEYMAECFRQTDTWKQWPARMLRHKAAIQAARYAFGFAGIMEPDEYERMHAEPEKVVATVPPANLLGDERVQRHDDAAEQYANHIVRIKEQIQRWDETEDDNALLIVAECWAEIPAAAQMDLWVAPTKYRKTTGRESAFTTHERDVIHNKLPRE